MVFSGHLKLNDSFPFIFCPVLLCYGCWPIIRCVFIPNSMRKWNTSFSTWNDSFTQKPDILRLNLSCKILVSQQEAVKWLVSGNLSWKHDCNKSNLLRSTKKKTIVKDFGEQSHLVVKKRNWFWHYEKHIGSDRGRIIHWDFRLRDIRVLLVQ